MFLHRSKNSSKSTNYLFPIFFLSLNNETVWFVCKKKKNTTSLFVSLMQFIAVITIVFRTRIVPGIFVCHRKAADRSFFAPVLIKTTFVFLFQFVRRRFRLIHPVRKREIRFIAIGNFFSCENRQRWNQYFDK